MWNQPHSNFVCVISSATTETKFAITDTKLYFTIVTSSTQDNAKMLELLKSGLKRRTNWNKYQSKGSTEIQNEYLSFLIDPSLQWFNRLFDFSFENESDRIVPTRT